MKLTKYVVYIRNADSKDNGTCVGIVEAKNRNHVSLRAHKLFSLDLNEHFKFIAKKSASIVDYAEAIRGDDLYLYMGEDAPSMFEDLS